MTLKVSFLRSRVARSVLLSFLLAAFIPFLFLSVLYYIEASRILVRDGHIQLQGASERYAAAVYDRLLLADGLLRSAAGDISRGRLPAATRAVLDRTFRGPIRIAQRDQAAASPGDTAAMPLDAAMVAHLRGGKSVLVSSGKTSDAAARMLLVQAVTPAEAKLSLVTAEIDAGYLWGNPEDFPYMISFCVFNQAVAELYCPQPLHPEGIGRLFKGLPQSAKGQIDWQVGQQAFLANFQELFLGPKFFESRWIVVAAQPEAIALGRIIAVKRIFWGSLALSILLVVLLSLTQIRRTLGPLERLIEGTRRLGRKDFTARVEVSSRDEFGELAGSFNAMAVRLGRQVDTMRSLSEIDRAILSELDIDRIVDDVLRRLKGGFNAVCASVSMIDQDSPDRGRVHALVRDGEQALVARFILPPDTDEMLRAIPNGLLMSSETARRTIPFCINGLDAQRFFTLPIVWKERLVGVICLGYAERAAPSDEDLAYIRDYADRVGVAITAAVREDQLYQQARTDALTGLPNRFHFLDQLKQQVVRAERDGMSFAVLFTDLDRFKGINDSLGHAAGDELLREVSARLRHCMREGDTIARLGGDEFTVLIGKLRSADEAGRVAEHVLAALGGPFLIEGVESFIRASIGIAVYPANGASAEELMRSADTAMYRAKDGGRGMYAFFEEAMNTEVVMRSTLERELRRGISEQQFILHYQPQVDLRTSKVIGVEALLRWRHPERGLVAPGQFIAVAEETGLIVRMGHIALTEACTQFRAWRENGVGLEHVAVNVSSRQFRQPDFIMTVEAALRENAMAANCLELEVTESLLLDDVDGVVDMLFRLKRLGVQISIDDFGTGYSSMSYLDRLPFDTLKIDMSFIRKIRDDGEGGTIAATIVAMAHTLGKKVVAEGAETQAQIDFLRKLGCEMVQGYFFSRPLPGDEIEAFVRKRQLPEIRSAPT